MHPASWNELKPYFLIIRLYWSVLIVFLIEVGQTVSNWGYQMLLRNHKGTRYSVCRRFDCRIFLDLRGC